MKMRISDLLDGWEDCSVELCPPPEVSPERIRERTMSSLRHRPNPGRRTLLRVLACAAAAAALTVSALAAYQIWGPGELFQSFFALESNALDDGQRELLDQIGTTDLSSSVSQGTTLTPLAAITDEHTLYLRLQVEAPDGTVLPDMGELEGHIFEDIRLSDTASGTALNWGMQKARFLEDETPGDNIFELVFILYGTPGSANWNDGTEKTLTLERLHLEPDVGTTEGAVVLDGTWEFQLSHFYQSQAVEVDTDGAVWSDPDHPNTITLDYLQLSPLSVSYRLHCTDSSLIPKNDIGIDLVLRDGSIFSLSMGNGTFGPDFMEGVVAFDTPIPLERIDYIRFQEHMLHLPQNP